MIIWLLVIVSLVAAIAANYSKRPIFLLSLAVAGIALALLLGHTPPAITVR